jgi:hypothetical protein
LIHTEQHRRCGRAAASVRHHCFLLTARRNCCFRCG